MNTPRYDLASGRQSRLWSSRLWILAALLGVLTMVHVIGVVHDDRAGRSELYATAQATAEQHAERINERLQFLAAETFAPVLRGNATSVGTPAADLALLTAAQISSEACRCRSVLPIAEFFRVNIGNAKVAAPATINRRASGGKYSAATSLSDSALISIARVEAQRQAMLGSRMVRLRLDPSLGGNAVATVAATDSVSGQTVAVGFVAPAHTLMQALFTVYMTTGPLGSPRELPYVDTLSLQVGLNDSSPLYGKLSADRPFRGKVFLHGPMDGLGVSVGLTPSEGHLARFGPRTDRLWALAALSVITILVIVIAVGTSRRETFLARARSDFIAGTSHDFRMPLAQILLAGETLQLRPELASDERGNLTRSIVRETHRLIGMVENVLLYSRSGAVELKPTLQSVPVLEVFEDVSDAVHLALEDAQQTIAHDVDSSLRAMADRHLLRQALVNLVDNAMKYGAPQQVIQLGGRQHSRTHVQLWVDDQGPGIPESQRARVFEPYERLTRDQASERAGSGLGLAVVYQIVKACGGRVWIETAPGGGTRCVIELASAST